MNAPTANAEIKAPDLGKLIYKSFAVIGRMSPIMNSALPIANRFKANR